MIGFSPLFLNETIILTRSTTTNKVFSSGKEATGVFILEKRPEEG